MGKRDVGNMINDRVQASENYVLGDRVPDQIADIKKAYDTVHNAGPYCTSCQSCGGAWPNWGGTHTYASDNIAVRSYGCSGGITWGTRVGWIHLCCADTR